MRALCIHEGNILVVKRSNYGEEYIIIPGGGIDEGESDFETAERELFEETTVLAKAEELIVGATTGSESGAKISEVFADEAGTEIWSLVMLAERLRETGRPE